MNRKSLGSTVVIASLMITKVEPQMAVTATSASTASVFVSRAARVRMRSSRKKGDGGGAGRGCGSCYLLGKVVPSTLTCSTVQGCAAGSR